MNKQTLFNSLSIAISAWLGYSLAKWIGCSPILGGIIAVVVIWWGLSASGKWNSSLSAKKIEKEVLMTKDEAITLITSGKHWEWKAYREKHPNWRPDLSGVDLRNVDLRQFNLTNTNLCGAKLPEDIKEYSNSSCWGHLLYKINLM